MEKRDAEAEIAADAQRATQERDRLQKLDSVSLTRFEAASSRQLRANDRFPSPELKLEDMSVTARTS